MVFHLNKIWKGQIRMKKNLYKGQLIMEITTAVEQCDDPKVECNNAHEAFDFDLMGELRTLVQAKGYYVNYTGVDLKYVKPASENIIEVINDAVKQSRNDEFDLRGQTTICGVYF